MTIKHNLTMDFQQKGELQRIYVMQGDTYTRTVALTLLSGGEPWEIPVCDPVVRYQRPDGYMDVYDKTMGDFSAVTWEGNVLTVELKSEMLVCAGVVQVQVQLHAQDLCLSTFPFLVVVEPTVAMGGEVR